MINSISAVSSAAAAAPLLPFTGLKEIFVPTTGGVVVLPVALALAIINPAGTLAALTVTLPPTPGDSQSLRLGFSQSITALTINGATVIGAPASITGPAALGFVYDAASASWYRI